MLQRLLHTIYPPQCVMCDALTEVDFGLCGTCWGKTPFIDGMCCDACGTPLPGQGAPDPSVLCDDCMRIARPWSKGRSVFVYKDIARRLVLALKHGDRTDLARAATPWLVRWAADLVQSDTVIVPVPLHRLRLLRRRYNQSAFLASGLARAIDRPLVTDGLLRVRRTKPLDGHSRDQRFEVLDGAIEPNPLAMDQLHGHPVLLVDDVMTSGATFAAATEACYVAGASEVCVLALARVVKDA